MPVNLMPAVEREWPAHLEPITRVTFADYLNSRSADYRKPPLPWRMRRKVYLARKARERERMK